MAEPGGSAAPKKTQAQQDAEEKEAIATALKNDGYNSAVVTRKMIQIHNMKEADAERLVGRLFGKRVDARAGDTTVAIISGLAMAFAAAVGIALLAYYVGLFPWFVLLLYASLFGIVGKGLSQAFMALVNVNAKEDLRKKD